MRGRKLLVGEPATVRALERLSEPLPVVLAALVETEHLFIEIGVEVERTRGNVGARDRPLEDAPKVLDVVGVNAPFDIRLRVVNDVVRVVFFRRNIGAVRVGVERRAGRNVFPQPWQQRRSPVVFDNERTNAPTT